jgi:hypothetical protein
MTREDEEVLAKLLEGVDPEVAFEVKALMETVAERAFVRGREAALTDY